MKVFEDFEPYATRTFRKVSSVRILCVKDRDLLFTNLYIDSQFEASHETLTDDELVANIRKKQNAIISGDGGSGKTFFMRKLWLDLFQAPDGAVPVFVELRGLNDLSKTDLRSYIRTTISSKGLLTDDLFNYFCKRGRFYFVLDGFDETPEDVRDQLQKEILQLSEKYPECTIIMSTRPESRFSG